MKDGWRKRRGHGEGEKRREGNREGRPVGDDKLEGTGRTLGTQREYRWFFFLSGLPTYLGRCWLLGKQVPERQMGKKKKKCLSPGKEKKAKAVAPLEKKASER